MHNGNFLIVAIISFTFGFLVNDYFNHRQPVQEKQNEEIEHILEQKPKRKKLIKDVQVTSPVTEQLPDFHSMDKKFYTHLATCEPLHIKSENGYQEYIIEGLVNDECLFKHRQKDFVDTICNLPLDVAQKYSQEGLRVVAELDELQKKQKTGFVQYSAFINEVNNNKNYCRYEHYQRQKR